MLPRPQNGLCKVCIFIMTSCYGRQNDVVKAAKNFVLFFETERASRRSKKDYMVSNDVI